MKKRKLVILDKKDFPTYEKSKNKSKDVINHSFHNGKESPKISYPETIYEVIDRYGYWIVGDKDSIAQLKAATPEEFTSVLRAQILQGCKEGACAI